MIILLQNVVESICGDSAKEAKAFDDGKGLVAVIFVHNKLKDINCIMSAILYEFRINHPQSFVENELGYWVMPCSTSWFLRFIMLSMIIGVG